jgi:hypothetical protein
MSQDADSNTRAAAAPQPPRSIRDGSSAVMAPNDDGTARGVALFQVALREHPLRSTLGLGVEYAMFSAGVGLALGLFVTRVPLRALDRALGLSLRERFIELLARVSPG